MTSQPERRPRVVLADDHPHVLAAVGRLLQLCCDIVASVANGHDAIEAVSRVRPDVLVVDLIMPDMDGLEICRRVKHAAPDTDVVIMTAVDDEQVQALAFQQGASAFVPKHAVASTLERTILELFAEKQDVRPASP